MSAQPALSQTEPPTRRERVAAKQKAESRVLNTIKRKIRKRQDIGENWDGTAANDNVAWPLAVALVKEGNNELLKYAMLYRRIYGQAKSEAKLGGASVRLEDGMSLDQRQWVKPNGEIAYKGVREVAKLAQDEPARRKIPPYVIDEESGVEKNWSKVPKPWNGDEPVNSMIDAQRELYRLQALLGRLCEPFELACIDCKTLQEVGNSVGIANRAGSMGAGKALVHMALVTIRDSVGRVNRQSVTKLH